MLLVKEMLLSGFESRLWSCHPDNILPLPEHCAVKCLSSDYAVLQKTMPWQLMGVLTDFDYSKVSASLEDASLEEIKMHVTQDNNNTCISALPGKERLSTDKQNLLFGGLHSITVDMDQNTSSAPRVFIIAHFCPRTSKHPDAHLRECHITLGSQRAHFQPQVYVD